MQAIIMAAGFGSRISKITGGLPKCFLEINGEKLIERAVRLLRERNICDIIVVTGYKENELKSLLDSDIQFVSNPLYFCTNVLGSFACGMGNITEDFIFIHADTIFHEAILDDLLEYEGEMVLPIDYKKCVEEEMKVITNNGKSLSAISKLIELDVAEGEFIGIAKIKKSVIDVLKKSVIQELTEKNNHQGYFEAAIQNLVDAGNDIKCMPIKGLPWVEIDFPEDYETAKEKFRKV